MTDPFEVRMRFTSQLQHLNASISSAQKAAQYALKNRDMDEDIHSCILEQLGKNNLNVRANIMFFLEALCDMSQRDGHPEFIKMVRRDIFAIVDAATPADQGGAANVQVVRKVLLGLQAKRFLEQDTVDELETTVLKNRVSGRRKRTTHNTSTRAALGEEGAENGLANGDAAGGAGGGDGGDEDDLEEEVDITLLSSPPPPPSGLEPGEVGSGSNSVGPDGADGSSYHNGGGGGGGGGGGAGASATGSLSATATSNRQLGRGGEGSLGPLRLGEQGRPDKRQIEQRIEEDRERHKRLKESIWEVVVPLHNMNGSSGGGNAAGVAESEEASGMWDDASEKGDDDYARAEEEVDERVRCVDQDRGEDRGGRGRGGGGDSKATPADKGEGREKEFVNWGGGRDGLKV